MKRRKIVEPPPEELTLEEGLLRLMKILVRIDRKEKAKKALAEGQARKEKEEEWKLFDFM